MQDLLNFRTDFLFPTPSFLTGAGSVLCLGGGYYINNISSSPEEADYKALLSDWGLVGNDLRIAMNQFEKEYG